jgi:hypothetical protein
MGKDSKMKHYVISTKPIYSCGGFTCENVLIVVKENPNGSITVAGGRFGVSLDLFKCNSDEEAINRFLEGASTRIDTIRPATDEDIT